MIQPPAARRSPSSTQAEVKHVEGWHSLVVTNLLHLQSCFQPSDLSLFRTPASHSPSCTEKTGATRTSKKKRADGSASAWPLGEVMHPQPRHQKQLKDLDMMNWPKPAKVRVEQEKLLGNKYAEKKNTVKKNQKKICQLFPTVPAVTRGRDAFRLSIGLPQLGLWVGLDENQLINQSKSYLLL